jgi:hypothetical protein
MGPDVAYFVFGATLCVALAGLAAFYFRRDRKEHVEAAKYRMLDDDEK